MRLRICPEFNHRRIAGICRVCGRHKLAELEIENSYLSGVEVGCYWESDDPNFCVIGSVSLSVQLPASVSLSPIRKQLGDVYLVQYKTAIGATNNLNTDDCKDEHPSAGAAPDATRQRPVSGRLPRHVRTLRHRQTHATHYSTTVSASPSL